MKKVDINSDIGESFGNYKLGMDESVLDYITSANIACGFHAGDPVVMERTVGLAVKKGVSVGAHPGYPDLSGFGRRNMAVSEDEVYSYVMYQLGAIMAFAKSNGVNVSHLKPHGAMYNMAAVDYNLARGIARAVYDVNKEIILVGLAGSFLVKAGGDVGLKTANEVFADRAYNDDGTLVSRKLEGSVIKDEEIAIKRVVRMIKEGKVTSISGKDIDIKADTICVHGDNPKAVEFVSKIKECLERENLLVCKLSEFIK